MILQHARPSVLQPACFNQNDNRHSILGSGPHNGIEKKEREGGLGGRLPPETASSLTTSNKSIFCLIACRQGGSSSKQQLIISLQYSRLAVFQRVCLPAIDQ